MGTTWWDILAAALSGGMFVKVLDHVYEEYKRRSEASKTARDLVNKHLDPILKGADELVGKIRSLAQSDFYETLHVQKQEEPNVESVMPHLEIVYLFAQFWARVQILSSESVYLNLGSDTTGLQLIRFLRALEARKTRLVDRAWQRGIGEALIEYNGSRLRSLSYFEFVEKYLSSQQFQEWFNPIISILERTNHTRNRQRFLIYGVILHALIDTLDSKHVVTRERPGWANKLSAKSRRALRFRIFRIYLPFVSGSERYYKTDHRSVL